MPLGFSKSITAVKNVMVSHMVAQLTCITAFEEMELIPSNTNHGSQIAELSLQIIFRSKYACFMNTLS